MKYLSVCAGIEAATVAWHPLGWTPVAFSEIDAFPSALLAHHSVDWRTYRSSAENCNG
jgi:DNA (cytosine-5)-methyltransferase 1